MKNMILFTAFLLLLIRSLGQQITSSAPSKMQTDYLQKSKKQKTAAWVLLGAGAAMVVVAAAIPQGESTGYSLDPITIISEGHENDGVKAAFGVIGVLSMAGSIPLFIAAGKNKRKAASLSLNNMKVPQIKNSSMVYRPMSAVSLKINL